MPSIQNKGGILDELTSQFLINLPDPEQIENLRDVLRYHEWNYYVIYQSKIQDQEYDLLFNHLKKLEKENPSLITRDSPTQRVANDLSGSKDSVSHIKPMLSLDNSYNGDDLREFNKQIHKLTGLDLGIDISYSVEPKYDGGSVAFVYEHDMLIRGATRGNGAKGEEMTANARTLPTIPLKAEFSKYGLTKVELRGEAVINKGFFDQMNEMRIKEGKSVFANPRNTAAGGLRTKDPNETRDRGIEVFMFEMGYIEPNEIQDSKLTQHFSRIEVLGELGFKIPQTEKALCSNIEEVIEFVAQIEDRRDDFPYEIDGMVIKVNDIALQEKCGFTQHHPRWAIAYKFKAKQAITTLEDIEYQVGKIGSITPVAKVKPVTVAGVTISSISLHNEEFIKSKDLRIGDDVLIERAGDVIPYIVKSFPENRDGSQAEVQYPKHCPINKSENVQLIKIEGEAAWRCPSCTCGAQDLQRMIFHVSKDAMDIDGFGKSLVERFHSAGWLHDLAEIYNLDFEKISELEGLGQKSAINLKASITKSKSNPLHRILHSLSIHHLGKKASRLIAERIENIFDLQDWSEEQLAEIPDIGPVVAKNVVDYFSDVNNITMLRKMESYGVDMAQKEADQPMVVADDAPFIGKTILFTGSLQKMTRKEAQKMAATAGAKNMSAVSANLNILVAGEKAGSKLKKAQALGTVKIMTEEEFLNKLNS